jgi:hypothetical protein
MDQKYNDFIIWITAIVLFIITFVLSKKDFTASATITLAFATFVMVKDSSKNIEVSKNNLRGEHMIREMEDLIKPIYMKRDQLESIEYVHIPYYDETRSFETYRDDANDFWESIEANKYLAPKDLRNTIIEYLNTNKLWLEKLERLQDELREASMRIDEPRNRDILEVAPRDRFLQAYPVFFDWRFINLPMSNLKDGRKQKINELVDRLDPMNKSEKEFSQCIQKFGILIDEDVEIERIRSALREAVIERYETLAINIDKIRECLE